MATILISGGTGLIGTALTGLLRQHHHQVIILTRQLPGTRAADGITYALWDTGKQTIDANAVGKADYIIHLAGAGVADKRWTAKRKQEIVESRVRSSALLLKGLSETPNTVKAVVSASAIGWYGADPRIPHEPPFSETDRPAADFLGETCVQWEKSIAAAGNAGRRLAILRTGIVLSNKGGALAEFMKPIRLGVAAILGSGKQVVSWIHIDDICRMYLQAITDESMQGIYNAVAPEPVSNKELTIALAKQMRKNFYLPVHVPAAFLKIGLGEMSTEVLKSTTVSASKIRETGFVFVYPAIDSAVNALVAADRKS